MTTMFGESKPAFIVGQLVKYKYPHFETKDCPHCGQEMEENMGNVEVTTTVTQIDASHFPDGNGGWRVTHDYKLKDGSYVRETGLEAA